ncbi:MAG: CoA transferase [SAR202 cluster bacterium]|jgi:crotonobetainyl-CoA:carnitine CoA-transferase CaiB-like acyl-CoA transferase|nr:CoA transferase [Chloroflexota bacterium]MQG47222.1 CoA transferase [SAR202 cluster bacterium]
MVANYSNTALEGMKVLDCSQILAGPFCSMLLADMGADVVKIEKPSGGDDTRRFGPPFINSESAAFLAINRNKRSLVLDFKQENGVAIMKKMVKDADVIIENYRTGAMDQNGLGYEELKKINPKLIYCSISGFGRTGPYAKRGGFDLVAQGMSGLMSFTGIPGSPPVKVGVPMADLNAGMFATYGILTAYVNRLKTGKGQFIETSLLEAAISYTIWESSIFFATGEVAKPLGSAHRLSAPYQALKTSDGYINIGAPNQSNWERFCKTIGRDDLLEDIKYQDNASRLINRQQLADDLEKTLSKKSSQEWLKDLEKDGVPAGPIFDISEVWSNDQVKSREMDVTLEHPTAGKIRNIGLATKLSQTPGEIKTAAPLLGQHTKEILIEMGYTAEEIEEFISNETVIQNTNL